MAKDKMFGFLMLPTRWLYTPEIISTFRPGAGVTELKTFYALLILHGQRAADAQRKVKSFTASIDQIADVAHVSRRGVVAALDVLETKGLYRRDFCVRPSDKRSCISRFALALPEAVSPEPWGPFPWREVESRGLLASIHQRSPVAVAALKIYLLLIAHRNTTSGLTLLKYETITQRLGIERKLIRAGLNILYGARLVHVMPREQREESNQYFVLGLRPLPLSATLAAPSP